MVFSHMHLDINVQGTLKVTAEDDGSMAFWCDCGDFRVSGVSEADAALFYTQIFMHATKCHARKPAIKFEREDQPSLFDR